MDAFSWASAVDTSTAPGVIDTVLTTETSGARVLSGLRTSLRNCSWAGMASVRTASFLYWDLLAIHLAAAPLFSAVDPSVPKAYGYLLTSA